MSESPDTCDRMPWQRLRACLIVDGRGGCFLATLYKSVLVGSRCCARKISPDHTSPLVIGAHTSLPRLLLVLRVWPCDMYKHHSTPNADVSGAIANFSKSQVVDTRTTQTPTAAVKIYVPHTNHLAQTPRLRGATLLLMATPTSGNHCNSLCVPPAPYRTARFRGFEKPNEVSDLRATLERPAAVKVSNSNGKLLSLA